MILCIGKTYCLAVSSLVITGSDTLSTQNYPWGWLDCALTHTPRNCPAPRRSVHNPMLLCKCPVCVPLLAASAITRYTQSSFSPCWGSVGEAHAETSTSAERRHESVGGSLWVVDSTFVVMGGRTIFADFPIGLPFTPPDLLSCGIPCRLPLLVRVRSREVYVTRVVYIHCSLRVGTGYGCKSTHARRPRRRLGPTAAETAASAVHCHTTCGCTARTATASRSVLELGSCLQSCAAAQRRRPRVQGQEQLERPALLAGAAARGQAVNFQTDGSVHM